MTDSKVSLVSISDVFGVGRLAESKAADRLVAAITSGTGRIIGPWLLKREFKTHLELQKMAEESLGKEINAEITLDDRSRIVLTTERLIRQQNREAIASKAIIELSAEPVDEFESEQVMEPDWISHFWRLAETVSDEDMQEIWARVLTGKVSGRSYSVRTPTFSAPFLKMKRDSLKSLPPSKLQSDPIILIGGIQLV